MIITSKAKLEEIESQLTTGAARIVGTATHGGIQYWVVDLLYVCWTAHVECMVRPDWSKHYNPVAAEQLAPPGQLPEPKRETMSKHTPGPLTVTIKDYPRADPPRRELVLLSQRKRIAVIDWDEGKDNPYTVPNDEAMANAHLFKAASELLQALIYIERGCTFPDNDVEEAIRDVARAAIANATGGSD